MPERPERPAEEAPEALRSDEATRAALLELLPLFTSPALLAVLRLRKDGAGLKKKEEY